MNHQACLSKRSLVAQRCYRLRSVCFVMLKKNVIFLLFQASFVSHSAAVVLSFSTPVSQFFSSSRWYFWWSLWHESSHFSAIFSWKRFELRQRQFIPFRRPFFSTLMEKGSSRVVVMWRRTLYEVMSRAAVWDVCCSRSWQLLFLKFIFSCPLNTSFIILCHWEHTAGIEPIK